MGTVEEYLAGTELAKVVAGVSDHGYFGAHLLAYHRAIIENDDVTRVLSSSYAGYGLQIANTSVVYALVSWIARVWDADKKREALSLPNAAFILEASTDSIAAARRAAHPDWDVKSLGVLTLECGVDAFCAHVRGFLASSIVERLMIFRDERLSHRLLNGRRRSKWSFEEAPEALTYREITELAEETLELLGKLKAIALFVQVDYLATARMYEAHSRSLWRLLPPLSDLERISG